MPVCRPAAVCLAALALLSGPAWTESPTARLRAGDVVRLAAAMETAPQPGEEWWRLNRLRGLLGADAASARVLGYRGGPREAQPEFAFLAASVGPPPTSRGSQAAAPNGQVTRLRSLVFLDAKERGAALIAFDVTGEDDTGRPSPAGSWCFETRLAPRVEGNGFSLDLPAEEISPARATSLPGWTLAGSAFLPRAPVPARPVLRSGARPAGSSGAWLVEVSPDQPRSAAMFLNVLRIGPVPAAGLPPPEEIVEIDLAGVRLGEWVVLFHAGVHSARSPLSFTVRGQGTLKYLITGLAPGTWEVWRNGWLEDHTAGVDPGEGALYFEGRSGTYFLRRLN